MKSKVGVAGCVKIRGIVVKEGFFCVPIIMNTDETSKMLFGQRVDVWLSRINHKNLTPSHRAEKKNPHCMFVGVILLQADQQVYKMKNTKETKSFMT